MTKQCTRGFTLIELMIVVAIVALLASVAYPAYTSAILKGKRAEGRAALTELMQQQERYMTQRNTYLEFTNTTGITNPSSASTTFKTFSGDSLAKASYYLKSSKCDSTIAITECVMVEAVPVKNDPEAGTLQILSTGVRTCNGGSNSSVCWK
ncbi:MAG: type IV pilin protein [Pseudomonadota bacterium]